MIILYRNDNNTIFDLSFILRSLNQLYSYAILQSLNQLYSPEFSKLSSKGV